MILTPQEYDGAMLHQRFAFRHFADKVSPLGDIIAFRGPMQVLAEHMIDVEDVMANAFIYSDDAINFLWEIPTLGQDAFGAVAYQRLFNTQIAELLSGEHYLNKKIIMDGDDIMVADEAFASGLGKCSVSITHLCQDAALGHTGINITAGDKAPAHAYSTSLNDAKVQAFMQSVVELFYNLNQDLFVATTKVL